MRAAVNEFSTDACQDRRAGGGHNGRAPCSAALMKAPIRILHLEDDLADAQLVREELREAGISCEMVRVVSRSEFVAALEGRGWDVILADYSLPGFDGLFALGIAVELVPHIPFIFVTGVLGEEVAVETLKRGATDYVLKDRLQRLVPAVTRALREVEERRRRQRAEEALRRSQQRAAREREKTAQERLELQEGFLSHVSHELRTPLASIHQFTTLLLDGLAGDLHPKVREYLEVILRNAEQLKRMIADLLTLTRCGSGKLALEPAFAALDELVRHACSSLEAAAAAGGVSVSAELPANLPAVCMDAARIYEVLINLIDNAIKYTPRGGKVLVKAGIPEDQPNFVRVSVCDTGRGIGPENVKRVFERFYQVPKELGSSRRGLGLGLFISRELVKAHGGAVSLESELGRGTMVSFTLPIFSLAPFIMPLLSPQNLEKGSIALLTIKLPPGAGPGDRVAPHPSRVVEILRRCIRSGNDILLPKFDERTPAGCFHALAFASPEEARAITHRIQERLGRLLVPETVEVFSIAVALPPAKNKSLLQVAHRISRRIERLVEAESLQHQLPEPQGASSPANPAFVRV